MGGVALASPGIDTDRLRALVDGCAELDVSGWPDAALSDTFIELRREIDRLEAVAAGLLARVEGRGIPYGEGAVSPWAWAQWRSGQRWGEAKASLQAAWACERLPLTHKAWAQGEISASAARMICRGLQAGHEDVYVALEETLVHFAAERNWRELETLIGYYRKICDQLDDREPADRNGLHLSPVGDRYSLTGDLDHQAGKTLDEALLAAMDPPSEGDERTPAQRRADAIVRVCRFFLDHNQGLPIEAGQAPHLTFTISWETILSWLPIRSVPFQPADTADLLSHCQTCQLLCDANIARIILGPNREPLDVGRAQRVVPRSMRRAIAHRDRGCRYPGCQRRANWCEAHHVIAWWAGGPTTLNNLILLCPFHHHVVHRKGWTNTFNGTNYVIHDHNGRRIE